MEAYSREVPYHKEGGTCTATSMAFGRSSCQALLQRPWQGEAITVGSLDSPQQWSDAVVLATAREGTGAVGGRKGSYSPALTAGPAACARCGGRSICTGAVAALWQRFGAGRGCESKEA